MTKCLIPLFALWLAACWNGADRSAGRAGGAQPSEDGGLHFPQLAAATGERAYPEALLRGTLVLAGRCLRVAGEEGTSYLVIWPPQVRLQRGETPRVSDPRSGHAVEVGQEVQLAGGEVEASAAIFGELREPLADDCPGPYWLASGIVPRS